jgi:hypothetical protein
MNDTNFIHIEVARKGRERAVERERERIIKALEDDGERNYISQEVYDYVVAIVRGETSE